MSHSQPHLMTLDALGANGWPLHTVRLPSLDVTSPGDVHVASFFIILIVTQGSASAQHVEQLDIHDGDIHIIPAGMKFQLLSAGKLEGWVIGFDPKFLQSYGTQIKLEHASNRAETQLIPDQSVFVRGLLRLRPDQMRWEHINQLATNLEVEVRRNAWGAQIAAQALLALLLTELFRELQDHAPRVPLTISKPIYDALTFLEQHCLEPISLQDIAAAVNRTPSHLANAIRKETGLTVGEWLREHRMVEARRRLLGTDASVENIAGAVGYADVTHFIRIFRRTHGMTPKVWRERQRESKTQAVL